MRFTSSSAESATGSSSPNPDDMADILLTRAINDYDHVRDLTGGDIDLEGC